MRAIQEAEVASLDRETFLTNEARFDRFHDVTEDFQANPFTGDGLTVSNLTRFTVADHVEGSNSARFALLPVKFFAITPLIKAVAWAGAYTTKDVDCKLCRIDMEGCVLSQMDMSLNIFSTLSLHPDTGILYGSFLSDNTIRTIDTNSGDTTVVIKSNSKLRPHVIKVTHDDYIFVGSEKGTKPIHKYSIHGDLLCQSPQRYKVFDIDYCFNSGRTLAATKEKSVVVLDFDLVKIYYIEFLPNIEEPGLFSLTAVFENNGNILIADWHHSELLIVSSDTYELIQRLNIEDMSQPLKLRMYKGMVWITCHNPPKIMCVELAS